MPPSVGVLSKLGMGPSGTATELYEFIQGSDIRLTEELFESSGHVGSRSHPSERVRQNVRRPNGTLILHPNSVELDTLLPRILGGAEAADVFPLAETLPTFSCHLDKIARVFNYTTCKVARARFRGSQGAPLEVSMDVVGTEETVAAAGTFPALSLNVATGPYMFHDLVAQVSAVTYQFREFELLVDNFLDEERFLNSQIRTAIPETDRLVQWTLRYPYETHDLYALAVTGVACVATFTNGSRSIQFNSSKVSFPRLTPELEGKQEIFQPLVGIARKSGATLELITTNDSV